MNKELSNQKSLSQSVFKCKIVFNLETIENYLIFIKAQL